MTLPIEYRLEAMADIDAAYDWYENQSAGLGERFLTALHDHIERIQQQPAAYAIEYREVRPAPMRRFPYVVYYRIDPDRLLIVAVQHGSRHPRRWKSRA
jgi:plasmid stabilization system protein ParE